VYAQKKDRIHELFDYYTEGSAEDHAASIERVYWEARPEPDEAVYETHAQRVRIGTPQGWVLNGWKVSIWDIGEKLAEGVGPTYIDALEDALKGRI
jgi:hypothetical protein